MGDTLDSVVQNWSYSRPPSTITIPPSAPPPSPPRVPAGLQPPPVPPDRVQVPGTRDQPPQAQPPGTQDQLPPVPPPPSGQADPSDPTSMPSQAPPPPLPEPPIPPASPPGVPDGLQPKTNAPGTATPLAPPLASVAAKQPTDTGLPPPVTDTPRWQEMSPTQLYNPQFPPVAVAIGQPESGMQNIRQRIKDPVTGQLQPAGQGTGPASGYFQIEDDTWKYYAPRMGVDLTKWPTAMAAPPQVQWAVAQSMPLNRWSRGTYAAFRQQYPWVNGNMTLGQINAQAGGTDEYGVPRQYLVAATDREAGARFQPDPSWNSGTPGMMPTSWDIPRIMSGTVPQLLALGLGLFGRVPLINAIAAYGSMAKAQQNGQLLEYQMNKDKWQTALKEHQAMETMEGQDVDDALIEFKDNPEDMKQAMMGIARRYNDPNLNMMAQQERFDLIDKLQKQRDKYNQPLQKMVLEQEKQQLEQEKIDVEKQKLLKGDTAQDEPIFDVTDADGKTVGQVREGKNGGLFDVGTSKPYTLQPGHKLSKESSGTTSAQGEETRDILNAAKADVAAQPNAPKEGSPEYQQALADAIAKRKREMSARSGSGEGVYQSKQLEIQDADGKTHTVLAHQQRAGGDWIDDNTKQPVALKTGEKIIGTATPTTAGGGTAGAQRGRQITGAEEVAADLDNVMHLPIGTTLGPSGLYHPDNTTVFGVLKGTLSRTMTTTDEGMMEIAMSNIKRMLTNLESPVYGTGAVQQQLDALTPKSGDNIFKILDKMATIRQNADKAINSLRNQSGITPNQIKELDGIQEQLAKSVPFTPQQVIAFAHEGKPTETFSDYIGRVGLGGGPPAQAIADLKANRNNPVYLKSFDKNFGPGAAERVLGTP